MHSVKRRLEVSSLRLVSIPLYHLVDELELQEQGRAWQVKAHIIAAAGLPFFDQRRKYGGCRYGHALSDYQVLGQAVAIGEFGELAFIHKGYNNPDSMS
jgi:hypothetical protein